MSDFQSSNENEGLPPRLPDDPPDELPTVHGATPLDERVRVITQVLEASGPT